MSWTILLHNVIYIMVFSDYYNCMLIVSRLLLGSTNLEKVPILIKNILVFSNEELLEYLNLTLLFFYLTLQ